MIMYKSPVELITSQMHTQIEDYVFNAIQEVAVNIDKEELIRALEYDRGQYDKGYRDGLNADRWVSVEDRLPEKNTEVLCYYKFEPDGPNVICENTYYGDGRWLSDRDRVSHWMPLPTPPTKKE